MKFYVIETEARGETIGCELTRKAAKQTAEAYGLGKGEYTIDLVEADVSAETIRRLLGNLGGYARDRSTITERN